MRVCSIASSARTVLQAPAQGFRGALPRRGQLGRDIQIRRPGRLEDGFELLEPVVAPFQDRVNRA
jgi:hypothetical protein